MSFLAAAPHEASRRRIPAVGFYDVQKRFGRRDAILAEDAPPEFLPITTAIWRAHRAIAYAAKKDFAGAGREYDAFRQAVVSLPKGHMAFADSARTVLDVSDRFIAAEIALQKQHWTRAADLLNRAAEIEDSLSYGEASIGSC